MAQSDRESEEIVEFGFNLRILLFCTLKFWEQGNTAGMERLHTPRYSPVFWWSGTGLVRLRETDSALTAVCQREAVQKQQERRPAVHGHHDTLLRERIKK